MLKLIFRTSACIAFAIALSAGAWAQSPASLTVSGDIQQPFTLTAADLSTMPRATATTNCCDRPVHARRQHRDAFRGH